MGQRYGPLSKELILYYFSWKVVYNANEMWNLIFLSTLYVVYSMIYFVHQPKMIVEKYIVVLSVFFLLLCYFGVFILIYNVVQMVFLLQNYSIIYLTLGITCGKAWTFTRVPQYEFVGTANQEVKQKRIHWAKSYKIC